ncbi:MAG: hypothetical protein U0694_26875 [Anaerolineae bacterium]
MEDPDDDNIVWMQNEPISLCTALTETDSESLACLRTGQILLAYEVGGTAVVAALAESAMKRTKMPASGPSTRPGVTFHDGSALDANDVVLSWAVRVDTLALCRPQWQL